MARDDSLPRAGPEHFVLIGAGLLWIWDAPGYGLIGWVASAIPGLLLLAAGLGMRWFPGDRRVGYFGALVGALAIVASAGVFVFLGVAEGVLRGALSCAAFVASGAHALRLEPEVEGVPEADPSFGLAARVAVDEAVMATALLWARVPARTGYAEIRAETLEAHSQFAAAGFLENPEAYHCIPSPVEGERLVSERHRHVDCEHLSFDSGYSVRDGEPGAERVSTGCANSRAHAWIVRAGEERPWLVCIHGYRFGSPGSDFPAFQVETLSQRYQMNLLLPVLPLHGPRKLGKRSGDGFLSANVMDTLHAEAQALFDLRQMLHWVRGQGATRISVYGLSLGAYNASLLSCYEPDLSCVIAGVPIVDFARLMGRHLPEVDAALVREDERKLREVLRVVSPLALQTRVPRSGRYVFGGIADRVAPPDHARDLWRHWDEPRIAWYEGAHLTFAGRPAVQDLLREAILESVLAGR